MHQNLRSSQRTDTGVDRSRSTAGAAGVLLLTGNLDILRHGVLEVEVSLGVSILEPLVAGVFHNFIVGQVVEVDVHFAGQVGESIGI